MKASSNPDGKLGMANTSGDKPAKILQAQTAVPGGKVNHAFDGFLRLRG